jgi:hypothetical protein
MKLYDSEQLYLGLIKVIRACVKDIQVWPSYYIWKDLGINAFTSADGSTYSLAIANVATTYFGNRIRVAIGIPNSNTIRIFQFTEDCTSYTEMTFDNLLLKTHVDYYGVSGIKYGKSLSFSKDGKTLVIGCPCVVAINGNGGYIPGFVRVLTCTDDVKWYLKGNHFNPSTGAIDNVKGFLYITSSQNLFGFSVASNDAGTTIYASAPQFNGDQGAITIWNLTSNYWGTSINGGVPNTYLYALESVGVPYYGAKLGKDIRVVGTTLAATSRANIDAWSKNFTMVWKGISNPATATRIDYLDGSTNNGTDSDGLNNSLAISGDENIIAIGFPAYSSSRGRVKVFRCVSSTNKSQIGGDILGPVGTAYKFGTSVALNNDGTILAIGSKFYDDVDAGTDCGAVTIYKLKSGVWTQYSQTLVGPAGSQTGFATAFLPNADKVFYLAPATSIKKLSIASFPVGSKIYSNL